MASEANTLPVAISEATTAAATQPMGIARKHPTIEAGDLVILFISHTATPLPLTVTPGAEFVNVFGAFPHDDMIGKPFGSRVFSRNKKGFIHVLRPTAALWTLALPHRTQILYYPDISFISSHLGLTPGARVIEAGTGSGSMTHALVRAVSTGAQRSTRWLGVPGMGSSSGRGSGRNPRQPRTTDSEAAVTEGTDADFDADADVEAEDDTAPLSSDRPLTLEEAGGPLQPDQGRVWSFEFHSERARKAKDEFEAHGIVPNVVALNHRNVCRSGFGIPEGLYADAIFLDLPAPWEAIPFTKAVLNPNVATRICTFSPCMEQVLRTTQALSDAGFSEVETFESLTREHQPFTAGLGPLKDVTQVADRLREIERVKEIKRLDQIERSRLKKEKAVRKAVEAHANEHGTELEAEVGGKRPADVHEQVPTAKRLKHNGSDEDSMASDTTPATTTETTTSRPKLEQPHEPSAPSTPREFLIASGPKVSSGTTALKPTNVLSKPAQEMRGHTSYLTFATLRPQHVVVNKFATAPSADPAPPKTDEATTQGAPEVKAEEAKPQAAPGEETTATA